MKLNLLKPILKKWSNRGYLFDVVIGNPPYQDDLDKNNRKPPVYNLFMDASYKIGSIVVLITPARFLFQAGQTPKQWNKKMLSDRHLKVLFFDKNSNLFFDDVEIKGGIAITCRNEYKIIGPISDFNDKPIVSEIVRKVSRRTSKSLSEIAYSKSYFSLSQSFYASHPTVQSRMTKGNEYILDAGIFTKMGEIFTPHKTSERDIEVYGRHHNKRISMFTNEANIKKDGRISQFKVLIPGANGSGKYGETLGEPIVAFPNSAATQTYMSFGTFKTKEEAINLVKYIKTKFLRALLGSKKVTQNNPKATWSNIPLEDLTINSDINWQRSITQIDQQLYKKYELSSEEIEFIEKNVKEMK